MSAIHRVSAVVIILSLFAVTGGSASKQTTAEPAHHGSITAVRQPDAQFIASLGTAAPRIQV